MKINWKTYWLNKNNRIVFVFSFVFLALKLFSFLHFLTFNENRKGIIINDRVLSLFSPIDLSPIIFIITYSVVLFGLILAFRKPELFLKLVQIYTILTLMRMLTLSSVALEPPIAIIPLRDVLLQSTFYSGRDNLKDLFFSGHVATLFILAFIFKNSKLKLLFSIGAIVVGILILLQHVHYSIDVIAAPVFAYFALIVQKRINYAIGFSIA